MKLLIDGDILLYKAGFAVESRYYIVKDTTFSSLREAKEFLKKSSSEEPILVHR